MTKIYVWVSSLEVAIVGSSLVDGPSCSSLSDGVVSCSSLGIMQAVVTVGIATWTSNQVIPNVRLTRCDDITAVTASMI